MAESHRAGNPLKNKNDFEFGFGASGSNFDFTGKGDNSRKSNKTPIFEKFDFSDVP